MCLENHGEVGIWEADKSQIANDQAPPTVLSLNTSLHRELLLFLIKNKDLMTHYTKNNKLKNSPYYIFWKKHKSQLVNRYACTTTEKP